MPREGVGMTIIAGIIKAIGIYKRTYDCEAGSPYCGHYKNLCDIDVRRITTELIEDYISSRDSLCF